MAKEKNLTNVTSIAAADFARLVTSAGASVKATAANLAKYVIETYNGSSVAGSSQSVKNALDSLNSNVVFESVQANISASGSFSINNNSPHSIFIVAYGTWNYSCLYIVFPSNGGTPVARFLSSYTGQSDDRISFSANGSWGITINNPSQYQMPVTVMKIKKG